LQGVANAAYGLKPEMLQPSGRGELARIMETIKQTLAHHPFPENEAHTASDRLPKKGSPPQKIFNHTRGSRHF